MRQPKRLLNKEVSSAFAIIIVFVLFLSIALLIEQPFSSADSQRYAILSFDLEEPTTSSMMVIIENLLDENNVSATFFVVGRYAAGNPGIVKNMSRSNEIACHTMSHKRLAGLAFGEKQAEISGCKAILENITGRKVIGFRAPYQLIDKETFEILNRSGFAYDSSTLFFQKPSSGIKEFTPSHMILPLEDYFFAYAFHVPEIMFNILLDKNPAKPILHTHLIDYYSEDLREYVKAAKKRGYKFITYEEYLNLSEQK